MKAASSALFVLSMASICGLWSCTEGRAQAPRPGGGVRVATYNLQWFSEEANPGRLGHLKSVFVHIQPDIVALQEVQSERALRQVFDNSWDIGMKDDPDDVQELAIAVRRPFVLVSSTLVFTAPAFEDAFPRGRDVLRCVVQTPTGAQIVLYVVHMKSRRGGRLATDGERQSACGLLAAYLAGLKNEKNTVVLGDFNDAPDDVSLSILETGDLLAKAGRNDQKLLVNVTEPLADKDFATEGVYTYAGGAAPSAVVPGAKKENDRLRGQDYEFPRDVRVSQTFFDQILVSPSLCESVFNVGVYCGKDAVTGNPGTTRVDGDRVLYLSKGDLASDHLPVWADLRPE